MIYFFSNGSEYVQCEIYPGRPHVLTVITNDGESHSERFSSSAHLTERWDQLSVAMNENGWMGPFGRDPRT